MTAAAAALFDEDADLFEANDALDAFDLDEIDAFGENDLDAFGEVVDAGGSPSCGRRHARRTHTSLVEKARWHPWRGRDRGDPSRLSSELTAARY
jgi:hypothetical protein